MKAAAITACELQRRTSDAISTVDSSGDSQTCGKPAGSNHISNFVIVFGGKANRSLACRRHRGSCNGARDSGSALVTDLLVKFCLRRRQHLLQSLPVDFNRRLRPLQPRLAQAPSDAGMHECSMFVLDGGPSSPPPPPHHADTFTCDQPDDGLHDHRAIFSAARTPAGMLTLPADVVSLIMRHLDWTDILRLSCVHPTLRNATSLAQVLPVTLLDLRHAC